MAPLSASTLRIIEIIKAIPPGKVMSYGQVAAAAGIPCGARMVVRILNSSSTKYDLPWWRVLRASGEIALPEGGGREEQYSHLEQEGVSFKAPWTVDLDRCGM